MPGKHRPPCCRNAIPPPACGKIEKKREDMPKLCVRACKDNPEMKIVHLTHGSILIPHQRSFSLHARTQVFWFSPVFSFDYPACEEAGWTISPCRMAFIISVPMIPVRFFHMISVHISLIQQGRFRRGGTLGISCAVREALAPAVRARFNRPPCWRKDGAVIAPSTQAV